MARERLKVLVLAGGPDRERHVSLQSGATVTRALEAADHDVRQRDIGPDDLTPLDAFAAWRGDVIFPVLHGKWGEGGGLQRILDDRGLPYVGCRADAAERCMDKHATKAALAAAGLPTPESELIEAGERSTLELPVVVKAPDEGSSIGLEVCRTREELGRACEALSEHHPRLLVERFVTGPELTLGVLGRADGGLDVLPPIQIVPAAGHFDFQAKYERDDTRFLFDIGLPRQLLAELGPLALRTAEVLGVRHLGRVDVIVDDAHRPWVLEVNTIPGFTSHSLLPLAAGQAGIELPSLVDRLVRLPLGERAG
ncbi:MAG: D-alanine--D-alanine ligase family protein [Phycisphaeraceae bacterium]